MIDLSGIRAAFQVKPLRVLRKAAALPKCAVPTRSAVSKTNVDARKAKE